MSPFDRGHTTFYSTLIETMCLSCTVFEIYTCIDGYLSKVADFDPPHLGALVGGDPGRISRRSLASEKRVPGLSCGFVCVILRLAVLVELRLVTDRQTQTQTRTRTDTGPWLVPRGKNHTKHDHLNNDVQSTALHALYTVSQKKQDTKLLPITSPNVNRFSKFFHWQTHW